MNINADWKIKQNSDVLQGGSGMNRLELLNKAKPILFNTEMVVAILDNKKTVTRRIVKFKGTKNPNWTGYVQDGLNLYNGNNEICNRKPPYKIGDILYVRETWCWCPCTECATDTFDKCAHKYCDIKRKGWGCYGYKASWESDTPPFDRWYPSILMPKVVARIFLRVKNVKVERLQDIVTGDYKTPLNINGDCNHFISQNDCKLLSEFKNLWDSTIKKPDIDRYGWKANPWVWVIEFDRITEEMK